MEGVTKIGSSWSVKYSILHNINYSTDLFVKKAVTITAE
jgi:hypothetical protein